MRYQSLFVSVLEKPVDRRKPDSKFSKDREFADDFGNTFTHRFE